MVPSISHAKTVLANGLRVVSLELPHLHTASVVVYAKVGSRYETAADNGLSHFLEHMLFRGTASHPSSYQLNFAIESLGGTLYAETGRDYSLYQIALAAGQVGAGSALLGEIFTDPQFMQIDLEREMILEEILEDFDEDGQLINVDDLTRRLAFGDHALGASITGPVANVERFTVADCRRHLARFYGARNLVLCASGPVNPAEVHAHAEKAFGKLHPGEPALSPTPAEPDGPRYQHVHHAGTQTAVQLAFRGIPETHPDFPVQQTILRVLDDGMSTRLHYRLCDQQGLAYSVGAGLDTFHDSGLLVLDGASAHAKLPRLVTEMRKLCDELAETEATPAELTKAMVRYQCDLDAACDDPDALAGWFGGGELFGPPLSYQAKLARMQAVTAEDVRRVAGDVFRPERLTVVSVGVLSAKAERDVRAAVTSTGSARPAKASRRA